MKIAAGKIVLSVLFAFIASIALEHVANAATGPDGQIVFQTAEEALSELKAAVKAGDSARLTKIFGRDARNFFSTGDPTGDAITFRHMATQLDQRAELFPVVSKEFEKEQWYKIRYGIEGWNMQIPLVHRGKGLGWIFATEHSTDANLKRRRAFNEVAAVDTLHALVIAQKEYKKRDRNGDGILEYAQKFGSSSGKQDGLYWPSADGSEPSPIDGMVVKAFEDGYKPSEKGTPTYYGYVYKILTAQGGSTQGGEKSYVKDGHMVDGFAIIAYPVKWGASGDSTFFISADADTWKKDLGSRTESIASKITSMDLDQSWVRVNPMLGGQNSRQNW